MINKQTVYFQPWEDSRTNVQEGIDDTLWMLVWGGLDIPNVDYIKNEILEDINEG